eukprot:scaffold876_cov243-Pinguiococcus_pyrenoidosus.AAC.6
MSPCEASTSSQGWQSGTLPVLKQPQDSATSAGISSMRGEAVLEEGDVVDPEEVVLDLLVRHDVTREENQRNDGRRDEALRLSKIVRDRADRQSEAHANARLDGADGDEVPEGGVAIAKAHELVDRERDHQRVDAHEEAVGRDHGDEEARQCVGPIAILPQEQGSRRREGQSRLHDRVHHTVYHHDKEHALRGEDALLRVTRLIDPHNADQQANHHLDDERLQVLLGVLGHVPDAAREQDANLVVLRGCVAVAPVRHVLAPDVLRPMVARSSFDVLRRALLPRGQDLRDVLLVLQPPHVQVGGVLVGGDAEPQRAEVPRRLFYGAGVRDPPPRQEDELVEGREDGVRRLVDRADDGAVQLLVAHEVLEDADDVLGHFGIQSRRGLVHEDHGGVREQLHANGDALALPSADTLSVHVAHADVGAVFEAELGQDARDAGLARAGGHVEAQRRRVPERLPGRQAGQEHVVLRDEAGHLLEVGGDGALVDGQRPAQDPAGVVVPRQHIEQRGLARAAGPHERHQLAGPEGHAELLEQGLGHHAGKQPPSLALPLPLRHLRASVSFAPACRCNDSVPCRRPAAGAAGSSTRAGGLEASGPLGLGKPLQNSATYLHAVAELPASQGHCRSRHVLRRRRHQALLQLLLHSGVAPSCQHAQTSTILRRGLWATLLPALAPQLAPRLPARLHAHVAARAGKAAAKLCDRRPSPAVDLYDAME